MSQRDKITTSYTRLLIEKAPGKEKEEQGVNGLMPWYRLNYKPEVGHSIPSHVKLHRNR